MKITVIDFETANRNRTSACSIGISYSCDYFCTLAASRVVWPELPAHDLGTVARNMGVDLDHHHAGSDANAAARMILSMLEEKRMDRLQMIAALTKRFESGNAVTPNSKPLVEKEYHEQEDR